MKFLLIAMPDAANNFHRMIQVPNLGLCNLAANLENHQVQIIDLILIRKNITTYLIKFIQQFKPQIVDLSSMSFQFDSALKIVKI